MRDASGAFLVYTKCDKKSVKPPLRIDLGQQKGCFGGKKGKGACRKEKAGVPLQCHQKERHPAGCMKKKKRRTKDCLR